MKISLTHHRIFSIPLMSGGKTNTENSLMKVRIREVFNSTINYD